MKNLFLFNYYILTTITPRKKAMQNFPIFTSKSILRWNIYDGLVEFKLMKSGRDKLTFMKLLGLWLWDKVTIKRSRTELSGLKGVALKRAKTE